MVIAFYFRRNAYTAVYRYVEIRYDKYLLGIYTALGPIGAGALPYDELYGADTRGYA